MQLSTDKILAEKKDGVGWVTINNPERRNAISLEMWEALGQVFEAYADDAEVRCAVIKGAGDKAFASGADISQFDRHRADAAAEEHYARVAGAAHHRMACFDKPLIAMIRGFCMGGGLGMAMSADLRVAAEDAVFGIPAARLGIAYKFANLKILVQLVGPSMAKEILLTARRLSAAEALRIGLVNDVVPVGQLQQAVAETTGRIVQNAPLAMRAAKLTVAEVMKDPEQRDHALMDALAQACFDSKDYQEGRAAFMAKRKPVFTGT